MKFSITAKLLTGFLSVAAVLAAVGTIGFVETQRVEATNTSLIKNAVGLVENAYEIAYSASNQVSFLREYFVTQAPDDQRNWRRHLRNRPSVEQTMARRWWRVPSMG